MQLPHSLVSTWTERKQQIFPAETAAVPIAFCLLQQAVFQRDVIAFVDNEAAVSALIRGSSRVVDAAQLAELLHAILLRLSCRVWVEWIDSNSNPADGLSRQGLLDAWTCRQGYSLAQIAAETFPPPQVDIFEWASTCLHWGR